MTAHEELRTCKKCQETKALSLFKKDPSCKGGATYQCKQCRNARQLKSKYIPKKVGPERRKEYQQRYKDRHPLTRLIFEQLRYLAFNRYSEKHRAMVRRAGRAQIANVSDSYTAGLLRQSARWINRQDIPPGLIAAKRAHIQVKRLLKEASQ